MFLVWAVRTNEDNTPSTGTANMLALAYGTIVCNGTIISGSGNFTVSLPAPGNGLYHITVTSPASLDLTNATCAVTGRTTGSGGTVVTTICSGLGGTSGLVIFRTARFTVNSFGTPLLTEPERDFSFALFRSSLHALNEKGRSDIGSGPFALKRFRLCGSQPNSTRFSPPLAHWRILARAAATASRLGRRARRRMRAVGGGGPPG